MEFKTVQSYKDFHEWIKQHGSPAVVVVHPDDYDVIARKFVRKEHRYTDAEGDFCVVYVPDTLDDPTFAAELGHHYRPSLIRCGPKRIPCEG